MSFKPVFNDPNFLVFANISANPDPTLFFQENEGLFQGLVSGKYKAFVSSNPKTNLAKNRTMRIWV